ncbi:superinfection immunity protein [Bradyrhizobium elkanii]|nr:superinfection immunity protein [Bradyrhizobium elkanii]WLB05753.1 superinfection immunity protein [Bradyrhizobium elkanii]
MTTPALAANHPNLVAIMPPKRRLFVAITVFLLSVLTFPLIILAWPDHIRWIPLLFVIMAGWYLYLLPATVAAHRGHHQFLAIFLINLFFGFSILGYFGPLVWACTAIQPKWMARV